MRTLARDSGPRSPRVQSRLGLAASLVSLVWLTGCIDVAAPTPAAKADGPGARSPAALASAAPLTLLADPTVLVGAGDIANCSSSGDEATAAILDTVPGTVFTAGDNVSSSTATVTDFLRCYDPSWGRHRARTRPAVGDKEYATSGAGGYFTYFGGAAVTGDSAKYYYSYETGGWHVVVLNSAISMSKGSAQELWLRSDLAAHPTACTVAIWDQPRFYTNSTRSGSLPLWNDLYAVGAELVLNGHQKNYERFAPQRPDGSADPTFGIREIIAGTGGYSHGSFGSTPAPNSEVRNNTAFGVLRVDLGVDRYHWSFLPIAGQSFTDSGTTLCHGPPPPIAKPGGPYSGEGTITFDGSKSTDFSGTGIASYAWDFGDGTTGTAAKPTHTYGAFGTYTVTLRVTNGAGAVSDPATTTATSSNLPPVVTLRTGGWAMAGTAYTLGASFTDPGNDGPFTVLVDWGDASSATSLTMTSAGAIPASHTYAAEAQFTVTVNVTDARGATSSAQASMTTKAPSAQAAVFIGAGDIGACGTAPASSSGAEITAKMLDKEPGTVFTLGDNTNEDGTLDEMNDCFGPTWGRHDGRMHPTVGNHEYYLTGAPAYWQYFTAHGVAVGDSGKYYYSYDLPSGWHVVVLNSEISYSSGSAQQQWLVADLAAHPAACTIALWHTPRYYAGSSSGRSSMSALWTPLYDARAEVVLNAHTHNYQRFAEMDPSGKAAPGRGLREFIAATGGAGAGGSGTTANLEVANFRTLGVLKLWLDTGGYYWKFLPIPGQTFTDQGYTACH